MLTIFATIVFIIGIVAAIIGLPMAALGCWFLALICAIGIVEDRLIKNARINREINEALSALLENQIRNSAKNKITNHQSTAAQYADFPDDPAVESTKPPSTDSTAQPSPPAARNNHGTMPK